MLSNLGNSFLVMIIGMVVVFIGLVVLIGCTKLMSTILNRKEKQAEPVVERAIEPQPAIIEGAPVEFAFESVAPEVVAAISAALMAFENSGKRLVVRSVRKAQGWGRAGRQESINY